MGRQKHSENKLVQKTSLNNIKYANLKHLHRQHKYIYVHYLRGGWKSREYPATSFGCMESFAVRRWKRENKTYLGWHGFQSTTGLNSAGIELMSYIWLSINRLRLMTLASRPFSFATNIALIKDLLSSCIARA